MDLEKIFLLQKPSESAMERCGLIRNRALETARQWVALAPSCPELTIAIRELDSATRNVIAAIVRNDG